MNEQTDDTLRRRAERRVKLKMGFFIHAGIFGLVNLGLFAIDSVSGGKPLAPWPLAGWGLGLAIHGIVTFVKLRGEGFKDRLEERELQRLQQRPPR
jgi:hypothetical protein